LFTLCVFYLIYNNESTVIYKVKKYNLYSNKITSVEAETFTSYS